MLRFLLLGLIILAGCRPPAFQDSTGSDRAIADSLAGVVRERYFARDYEGGVFAGRDALADVYTAELHAWYLVNRAEYREPKPALAEARALIDARPESPWGWVAASAVMRHLPDSLDGAVRLGEQALGIAPDLTAGRFVLCRALVDAGRESDALKHLDGWAASPAPELDLCRAEAYYALGNEFTPNRDAAMIDSSHAVYARLRRSAPAFVDAFYLQGDRLGIVNRHEESLDLLTQALQRAPHSASVRMEQAHALLAHPGLSDEDRYDSIRASIAEALALRPEGPETIYTVIDLYSDIDDMANRDRYEAELIRLEPEGPRAEWTLLRRIRRFADEHEAALYERKDPDTLTTYRTMLRDFASRDWVYREDLLGETFMSRYRVQDSTVSDAELLDIVQGMASYEILNPHIVFRRGPMALADRRVYFREAEHIANRGFDAFRRQVVENKDRFSESDYESMLRSSAWQSHDALGWIYLHEGRLDEAEAQLARANDLVDGAVPEVLWHLGRLYEARYDRAQAGDSSEVTETLDRETLFVTAFNYYKAGTARPMPGANPNEASLRDLYVKRNGSVDGYEAFLHAATADNSETRRQEVLAARLDGSQHLLPFELTALSGQTFTRDDLAGKVVVLNVWSITCGPCLLEMPEIQQLFERYASDPEVRVLTLADDPTPGETKRWMEEQGYSFPVLIDEGYRFEMGVFGIPFTWFLDREGRIVYEKLGWSQHLLEEFVWRIESLR
jgi:tetratricopeptide (TPR) repeat protein